MFPLSSKHFSSMLVDIMGTVISRFWNPEKGNLEQKSFFFFFLIWLKQAEAMDLERNTGRVMAF